MRFSAKNIYLYPCLEDAKRNTPFDAHYIYHPAWAMRIIVKQNPLKHIDISSTLHFCTMLSAVIPTEFYDYRPAALTLSNLSSGYIDLTNLDFESDSIESISCMHTIEHIGLGRYGDPIDPKADITAIEELKRIVKRGGSLFIVVPIGSPSIQFNAHRIYSFDIINNMFQEFELSNFSLICDNQEFIENASVDLANNQRYGCGCFHYVKK